MKFKFPDSEYSYAEAASPDSSPSPLASDDSSSSSIVFSIVVIIVVVVIVIISAIIVIPIDACVKRLDVTDVKCMESSSMKLIDH